MSLSVVAIQFNHDPNSASHDALNLRIDGSNFVDLPEWKKGVHNHPAAYAIKAVGTNTITIKALFRFQDDQGAVLPGIAAEVRATSVSFTPFPPFKIFNPLGDVLPRSFVTNAAGESGWVTFNVTGHLGSVVRSSNINWRWEMRDPQTGQWVPFATTHHRIYVLLDVPTAPWQQTPHDASNTQLPWTTVLDFACSWAHGASTAEAAAGMITDHVYALGPATLSYDCPGFGGPHYSSPAFDCTKFLERLHGGSGNGLYVNCSDCATITSSFANILGCDLWQSRMGISFDLNPILAIGSSSWYPGCPNWLGHSFNYHEVAWTGACLQNDRVFDACLQVDGDSDPTQPPHVGVQPKNMVFGPAGTLDYRGRLSPPTPTGQAHCNPLAGGTRVRRMVV